MTLDVLVIGAGPTGLFAAFQLQQMGLSYRLIDKLPAPTEQSRALAIHARTLEVLDHWGLVEAFLEQGLPVHRANLLAQSGRLAQIELGSIPSPYPFVLSLEQSKTEAILARQLSVQPERGAELVSLTQDADVVRARIRQGSREETVEARWVIGCDGAHSATRKALGLEFAGTEFPEAFSLADVEIQWPFPHDELVLFLDELGLLAAIPLPEPTHVRLVFQNTTLDEIPSKLRAYLGDDVRIVRTLWQGDFHVHNRMVKTFQEGRVFLAGDSAHIHSPAGGQGMNTGLQDVDNLVWKLALVHRGRAPASILLTYTEERRPVAAAVLSGTKKMTQVATLHTKAALWLRNRIAPFFLKQPWVQAKAARLVSQTAIHYAPNQLVVGRRAGMRAPMEFHTLCKGSSEHHVIRTECEPFVIRPDFYIGAVGERGITEYFRAMNGR